MEEDKENSQLIYPYMKEDERGIVTFAPIQALKEIFYNYNDRNRIIKETFISNCLKQISIFEGTILMGI